MECWNEIRGQKFWTLGFSFNLPTTEAVLCLPHLNGYSSVLQ